MSSLDACPGNGRLFYVLRPATPKVIEISSLPISGPQRYPDYAEDGDSISPVNKIDDTLVPQVAQITLSYTLLPFCRENMAGHEGLCAA